MTASLNGFIAAQRFGLGARPEELSRISDNPRQWLKWQISSSSKGDIEVPAVPTNQLIRDIVKAKKSKETRKELRKQARDIYAQEMEARFRFAVATDRPFVERLVQFWSNHFTISFVGNPFLSAIVGAFEREAIRPYALGKFADMLVASTRHPAMLLYLNNASSVGANSRAGKKRGRGLNENLAREILELHTLGVNGGYNQDDVISFAKILTGWSLAPIKSDGGGFRFLKQAHEPGAHTLLGKIYQEGGEKQGLQALIDLSRHPSTARFIATKLVRHFVDDEPPQSAIAKIEKTFAETDGDLRAVSLALIDLKEAWQNPLAKIKTPYEMIVSSFRLIGDEGQVKIPFKKIGASLKLLDHVPFSAGSPAGWPDQVNDWISPNAVINRVEWCQAFAQYVRLDRSPHSLAEDHIGQAAKPETLLWIERAPSAKEGLALLLASPEWQRR